MKNPENRLFERYIQGWTQVTAKGGSVYRFINAMRDKAVVCRRQHFEKDCFHFITRRMERRYVRELAAEYSVQVEMKDMPSLSAWLYKHRSRIGIPLGIILGAGLLIYCSNVVMVIDIQGNEQITDQEILAVLEECSVERGAFIGKIDFYRSELRLRSSYDNIAWVGMRHTGNRLVVEVMETYEKPEMLEARVPCHIISEKTAQITKVKVGCGQLIPIVGDAVKEGDVLVSGIYADEYGHVTFRHSMAEITGIYEEEQTFFCAHEQQVRCFTGSTMERRSLDLFSLEIPLSFEENPYADYNLKTEKIPLTLFGKELPISLERSVFMEYSTETQVLTEDEILQNLQIQQENYETNFLSECSILQRKTKYTKKETAVVLTVSYVIEGEIGTQQELLLKSDRKPYVASRKKDET